jgi:hypothetical protein
VSKAWTLSQWCRAVRAHCRHDRAQKNPGGLVTVALQLELVAVNEIQAPDAVAVALQATATMFELAAASATLRRAAFAAVLTRSLAAHPTLQSAALRAPEVMRPARALLEAAAAEESGYRDGQKTSQLAVAQRRLRTPLPAFWARLEMHGLPAEMQPRQYVSLYHAVAVLAQHGGAAHGALCEELERRIIGCSGRLDAQNVTNTLWAAAVMMRPVARALRSAAQRGNANDVAAAPSGAAPVGTKAPAPAEARAGDCSHAPR